MGAGDAYLAVTALAIATYDRAHLVGRAIRSALAQTAGDLEVIVVDDGSSDAMPEVVGRVADPRLRVIRHERNHGISRARNTAIECARGQWLAFLDDDNEWATDYLERQLAVAASRPAAGVIYCRARLVDARTGMGVVAGDLRQGRVFCDLVAGWNPFVSSALIRRSALADIGGLDERLRATEDRDLWMRLAEHTEFAGATHVLLTRHVRHGPQLSRNPDFLAGDAEILAAKWRRAVTAACGRRAFRRWRLRLFAAAERCRMDVAAERGGERAAAIRSAGRLLRRLPGSAPAAAGALLLAVLGGARHRALGRRLDWYRERARRMVGGSARGRRAGMP